jgi:hypothetical protein
MQLPFTSDQFNGGVFRDYNAAVWPVQFLHGALVLLAILLALRPSRWSGVAVSAIPPFLWAWIAVVCHWAFFTLISPAAYVFAMASASWSVPRLYGQPRRESQHCGVRCRTDVAIGCAYNPFDRTSAIHD